MTRVGTAGYPRGSKGPSDALRRLREAGLDAMEIQFVRQVSMPLERARAIGEEARALGVRLSAHAPYYVNFNSDSGSTRQRSAGWVLETVRRCHAMGARVAVVHAASYGKSPAAATGAVVEGLRQVREAMDDEGLEAVLGLELMGRRSQWGDMEELAQACAAVEGTAPVLDFAHLHARSAGGLREKEDFIAAIEECRRISGEDPHCHCSGVEYGDKGERRHLDLDAAEPDYGLLAEAAATLGDKATLIVESPRQLEDAVLLRRLLGK